MKCSFGWPIGVGVVVIQPREMVRVRNYTRQDNTLLLLLNWGLVVMVVVAGWVCFFV
jgi:putative heme iron utilization protein